LKLFHQSRSLSLHLAEPPHPDSYRYKRLLEGRSLERASVARRNSVLGTAAACSLGREGLGEGSPEEVPVGGIVEEVRHSLEGEVRRDEVLLGTLGMLLRGRLVVPLVM
jgi:hypothetical protein